MTARFWSLSIFLFLRKSIKTQLFQYLWKYFQDFIQFDESLGMFKKQRIHLLLFSSDMFGFKFLAYVPAKCAPSSWSVQYYSNQEEGSFKLALCPINIVMYFWQATSSLLLEQIFLPKFSLNCNFKTLTWVKYFVCFLRGPWSVDTGQYF